MNELVEGNIRIGLPRGARARKFDDVDTHKLSHCMKAVDFVVELNDRILFIECKDPDNSAAQLHPNKNDFIKNFEAGEIDEKLKTKYRDTFLYEWGSGRANKPIYYLVLIGLDSLDGANLLTRTEALKRKLPINGPDGQSWKNPLVAGCAIMNFELWNQTLPAFPASRIP